MFTVLRRAGSKLFLPMSIRTFIAVFRSVKYIRAGLTSLLHGRLAVSVLDATAVTVSMVRGDFDTASSVMFMLNLGEILEDWTHKKSVADLAGAMSLNVDKVWLKAGGTEVLVPIGDVKAGDCIVVRTGGMIPLDGKVVEGEATVNQSSITGESMPVPKGPGSYVYAGTVTEEGECVIRVDKVAGGGRYDRIVRMIEESEKLKSTAEDKASRLADPSGALYAGRHGPDLSSDTEYHEGPGRPNGGLFLRIEAVHAHRRSLRHAGEPELSYLRQGRPLHGGGGQR